MNRISRAAVWAALLFAALFVFTGMSMVDQSAPMGANAIITVSGSMSVSKRDLIAALDKAAGDNHVNVYKIQPALRGSMRSRDLFAFIGDEAAFERNGGWSYPDFSPAVMRTTVRPSSDITFQDMRGSYATNATGEALDGVLQAVRSTGLEASSAPASLYVSAGLAYSSVGVGGVATMIVFAVTLLVSLAWSLSRQRRVHAIETMNGWSGRQILAVEMKDLLATLLIGAAGVMGLCAVVLAVYNHWHQAGRFFAILGILMALLSFGLLILDVLLGGARTMRESVPAAVGGEARPLRDGIIAGAAQVVVLAVVFASVCSLGMRAAAIGQARQAALIWEKIPDQYALRLSLNTTGSQMKEEATPLRDMIRRLDAQGQVTLAGYKWDPANDDGHEGEDWEADGRDAMIVNPHFLDLQPVNSTDGTPVTVAGGDENAFTLLVPDSYQGDADALLRSWEEYFSIWCVDEDNGVESCSPHGTLVRTAAGQSVSRLSGTKSMSAEDQGENATLTDPVLAVVSPSSILLWPLEWLSYTSNDQVLFSDPDALQAALQDAGIADGFQGIDDAADSAAWALDLSRREQEGDLMALVLCVAAFLLSTTISAAVYCDRRRRMSLVEFINGYTMAQRHGAFLAIGLAASILAVAVTAALRGLTTPACLAAGAILVAANLAITAAMVASQEARMRGDDIKRT